MTDGKEQEAVMVRYLLGQSPEEERAQVEEMYFSDGGYFDQLIALEDSLIDDFVTGRMPAEQLRAFKKTLSRRQDDIRFTRSLFQAATKKKLDPPAPEHTLRLTARQRPLFAQKRSTLLAASIAALVILALAFALFLTNQTLQNRLSEVEAQLVRLKEEKEAAERELSQARSQSESSAQEVEIERNKRIDAERSLQKKDNPDLSSDNMTIVLGSAFIPRGATGTTREVRVSENVRYLRLVVPVIGYGEHESYRVSIKLAGGREIFESGSLQPTGRARILTITVPATSLRQGDHIVTLYGERPNSARVELEQFSFRIVN